MNTQNIKISNSSEDIYILVNLSSPEDLDYMDIRTEISPNSVKKINTKGGVMNMTVWKNSTLPKLIWNGVIPTKINEVLIINPTRSQVFYDGIEIPSSSLNMRESMELAKNENNNENNNLSRKNLDILPLILMVILILVLILIIYKYIYYKNVVKTYCKK
jgi:hypothetical protein